MALMCAVAGVAAQAKYRVKWVGEMHKVMMMGEDKGIFALDSLKGTPNLYAIGPMEGLNGEITVFDSVPVIATVKDGKAVVENTFNVQAPLLVWVQVARWSATPIPASVQSLADLSKFVEESAKKAGLDMNAPIPFRVTAHAQQIGMHIVNRQGRDAKGHEAHAKIEVKFPLNDADAELIGFWSDKHGGIFTHAGETTHIHGRTIDNKVSGHVDELKIGSGQLWLPSE